MKKILSKGNKDKKGWKTKPYFLPIVCPRCKYDQFYRPMGGLDGYQFICGRCWFRVGKETILLK